MPSSALRVRAHLPPSNLPLSHLVHTTKPPTPVVVINEADGLSRDAQAALRRTMEKYMSNLRIILCANSTSRLIAPIKSRCLLMRVAAPNAEEMMSVLDHVARRVGFDLPPEAGEQIVADSGGNLRKAILVLEALKMQS